MVANANVLGIDSTNGEFYDTTNVWDPQVVTPVLNWLTNNPTKHPTYVILFYDIPTRLWLPSEYPCGEPVYDGSVSYQIYSFYPGWKPFVNNINAGSLADCEAYVDKLASMASNSPNKLVIGASVGGYGNTNYAIDNNRNGPDYGKYGDGDYSGSTDSNALGGLTSAGVSTNPIIYNDGVNTITTNGLITYNAPYIASATNVAGYICWGEHSVQLGGEYATNGLVNWHGNSGWWIIETLESFDGMRSGCGQGNFVQWFSSNAFGGTNYVNTPVGAVSHVEEPEIGNLEDSAVYFGLWASGKNFAICAWNSRQTQFFQAVGDPFVKR